MNTQEAIKSLESISYTLEMIANKPQHYNTEWGYYLEKMSWEMHKQANELRYIESMFVISQ